MPGSRKPQSPGSLLSAKLAESGITKKESKKLRMELLNPDKVVSLNSSFKPYHALKIPYFTLEGKRTDFYRLRYLGEMNGFDALRKKPVRYVQPPGTRPEAYFPPLLNWNKTARDQNSALFITEGELKAGCACLRGFPTIGLGGVWSWKSTEKNIPMLPVFDKFEFAARSIYIVFDSDFMTNPDVMRALVALAKEFTARGAQPYIVTLPDLPAMIEKEKKTGLDDFLVLEGQHRFEELIIDAVPFDQSRELWKLNEEVVYIKNPGLVIVLADGRKVSSAGFKEHAYANRHYYETKTDKDGNSKQVKKPLAPDWMKWECRSELFALTYKPGQPPVTDDNEYNYWSGWGVEPEKGDISLWRQLLDYMFKGDTQARTWFERWAAYPVQNPGAKLYSAVVIWGRTHGTGKSLIGLSLGDIYGKNFSEISDEELSGAFNEWAENKQFVLGDEITSQEHKKSTMEHLRFMITRQKLRVNAKYIPSYEVPDCINYYFTANHPDAFLLDDMDRRYFIWQSPRDPLPRAFYDRYDDWKRTGRMAPALLFHLQHLDLGNFNPHEHAMVTAAKKQMILEGKNEVAAWCAQLSEHPDAVLRFGDEKIKSDLFTATQLLRLLDEKVAGKPVTTIWLGRELKKAGFEQVNEGKTVMTAKGPQRIYAIRNAGKWARLSPVRIAKHWNEAFASVAVKKKEKF
jgi:hypothetical protein